MWNSGRLACALLVVVLQVFLFLAYVHHRPIVSPPVTVDGPFTLQRGQATPLVSFGRVRGKSLRPSTPSTNLLRQEAPTTSSAASRQAPCWYEEEKTRGTGLSWSWGPPLKLHMRMAGFGTMGLELSNTGHTNGPQGSIHLALDGHPLPSIPSNQTCNLLLAFRDAEDLEVVAPNADIFHFGNDLQVFAHHCPRRLVGPSAEALGSRTRANCESGQQVWIGWCGCFGASTSKLAPSFEGHDWRHGRIDEVINASHALVRTSCLATYAR
ncbi:PRKAA1 [Symbiodinium natans]|uniref:PRKAA1 protein n=1 Tax=Symbiodinium natans TaxID=878477 RepID=A0A812HKJ6_9DINO|nr:PRKAA1 [Symbiodinium natans]